METASPTQLPPVLIADLKAKEDVLSREYTQQNRKFTRWNAQMDAAAAEQQKAQKTTGSSECVSVVVVGMEILRARL